MIARSMVLALALLPLASIPVYASGEGFASHRISIGSFPAQTETGSPGAEDSQGKAESGGDTGLPWSSPAAGATPFPRGTFEIGLMTGAVGFTSYLADGSTPACNPFHFSSSHQTLFNPVSPGISSRNHPGSAMPLPPSILRDIKEQYNFFASKSTSQILRERSEARPAYAWRPIRGRSKARRSLFLRIRAEAGRVPLRPCWNVQTKAGRAFFRTGGAVFSPCFACGLWLELRRAFFSRPRGAEKMEDRGFEPLTS